MFIEYMKNACINRYKKRYINLHISKVEERSRLVISMINLLDISKNNRYHSGVFRTQVGNYRANVEALDAMIYGMGKGRPVNLTPYFKPVRYVEVRDYFTDKGKSTKMDYAVGELSTKLKEMIKQYKQLPIDSSSALYYERYVQGSIHEIYQMAESIHRDYC